MSSMRQSVQRHNDKDAAGGDLGQDHSRHDVLHPLRLFAASSPGCILEHPRHERRRRIAGRGLDENAPQSRRRLCVAHKPLALPLRLKPSAAVLLIEFLKHTGTLGAPMPASIRASAALARARPWHGR